MIWLTCDSLPFYAHAHTCSPSYTDEEQKTNVDSEIVCLRLLIKGLIVPIKLCMLSIHLILNLLVVDCVLVQLLVVHTIGKRKTVKVGTYSI